MIAFRPANAALVAVMSAFPRLISGRSGRLGVEAVMGIGYDDYDDYEDYSRGRAIPEAVVGLRTPT